jgi:hypothetical protein
MSGLSDFLFARQSFLRGVASVLDSGGTLTEFNQSLTPEQADAAAMRMDWEAVGHDLRGAMAQFERESLDWRARNRGAGAEGLVAG